MIRNFIVFATLTVSATAWAEVGTSSTSTAVDLSLVDDFEDPPAKSVEAEVDDVIEQIVVTGSRTEKLLKDAPVATDVIDQATVMQTGAPDLKGVLETMPGVQLERRANNTGIQLQGLNPEHTLMLVDSERIAGRTRDQFDAGQFDLENVERVEIIRGAASALYGSDAMGGVVNIITRLPKQPLSASARATYGARNTLDLIGNTGVRTGKLALNVSGGFHRGDAFDLSPGDGTRNGDPTTGDAFASWNVAARADYEADEDTRAGLRFRYRTTDLTGVNAANGGRAILDRNERIERMTISGGPVIELEDASKLRVSVVHSRYRQQIDFDHIGSDELDSFEDNRQSSNQATVQYDRLFGAEHFVSVGVEGLHEDQDVAFLESRRARRRGSIFAQDEWTILEDTMRLVVIPSLRYDHDSQFGGRPSPRFAVRFDPFRELVLRASYGWGFRAPTFENLYLRFTNPGSGYVVYGNEELRPEVSQGVNADVSYTYDDFVFTAAGFFNLVDDLIATVGYSPRDMAPCRTGPALPLTLFCYENVADARTMGASLGVGWRLEEYIQANLSLDLLQTSGLFGDEPEGDQMDMRVRQELPARPNVRATLRVTGQVPDWGTRLVVRTAVEGPAELFVDFDFDGEDDVRGTFALVDLRLSQDLFGHAEAFIGVENLLDAGEHNINPLQPRTFYAGIAGRFDVSKDDKPTR